MTTAASYLCIMRQGIRARIELIRILDIPEEVSAQSIVGRARSRQRALPICRVETVEQHKGFPAQRAEASCGSRVVRVQPHRVLEISERVIVLQLLPAFSGSLQATHDPLAAAWHAMKFLSVARSADQRERGGGGTGGR